MKKRTTPSLCPGFVDLQVNGYKGVDFSLDGLRGEDAEQAIQGMVAAGTAAFLPTLITSPLPVFQRNLEILAQVLKNSRFKGRLPGIHLEGPFLSPQPGAIGAHNPAWVVSPDPRILDDLQSWAGGSIRLITIAAEVPGAEELCRHAVRQGITVFLGHHLALDDDLRRLAQAGARALTHLGNGLPGMVNRHHNPIWSGLGNDDLAATFIADGHHLPPTMLKSMLRAKGLSRSAVVSDAASLAGMPPGAYHAMGNDVVLEPSGRLHNPKAGFLVGSSYTMLQCANVLLREKLCSVEETVALCYHNPLALAGLSEAEIPPDPLIRFDEGANAFQPASSRAV